MGVVVFSLGLKTETCTSKTWSGNSNNPTEVFGFVASKLIPAWRPNVKGSLIWRKLSTCYYEAEVVKVVTPEQLVSLLSWQWYHSDCMVISIILFNVNILKITEYTIGWPYNMLLFISLLNTGHRCFNVHAVKISSVRSTSYGGVGEFFHSLVLFDFLLMTLLS